MCPFAISLSIVATLLQAEVSALLHNLHCADLLTHPLLQRPSMSRTVVMPAHFIVAELPPTSLQLRDTTKEIVRPERCYMLASLALPDE